MKRLTDERIAALVAPDEMTVETAYAEVQTNWNDAKYYTIGWNACRAAMRDLLSGEELTTMPAMEKSMKKHKEYLAKEAALAKIISTAGKDPSEITDAVWAAGYRKPERTEAEVVNLIINIFAGFKYGGIPEDDWPKTYDEILQCELSEIIGEVTWSYFSPENIASRLIKAGYSLENAND